MSESLCGVEAVEVEEECLAVKLLVLVKVKVK